MFGSTIRPYFPALLCVCCTALLLCFAVFLYISLPPPVSDFLFWCQFCVGIYSAIREFTEWFLILRVRYFLLYRFSYLYIYCIYLCIWLSLYLSIPILRVCWLLCSLYFLVFFTWIKIFFNRPILHSYLHSFAFVSDPLKMDFLKRFQSTSIAE